jgi:FkbM family methyltransferase
VNIRDSLQRTTEIAKERQKSGIKRYLIGDQEISLPFNHNLPSYQAENRLYDRFLPFLCRQIGDASGWIIDVGANVGDTAVSMAQACQNPLLCIEGDSAFFGLLRQNVLPFEPRVRCREALVGTGRFSGKLTNTGTTAYLSHSLSSPISSIPLDQLVAEARIDRLSLLKVDVDGYDSDVLLSGSHTIAKFKPILFWENACETDEQFSALDGLYDFLTVRGYRYLWVFDNFGNLMLAECSFQNIRDLTLYVRSQDRYRCTRTIFYTDVLAVPDELDMARKAISRYRDFVATAS